MHSNIPINFYEENKKTCGDSFFDKAVLVAQFESQNDFPAPTIADQIRHAVCLTLEEMSIGYYTVDEKATLDSNINKLVQALVVAQKYRSSLSVGQIISFQESLFFTSDYT